MREIINEEEYPIVDFDTGERLRISVTGGPEMVSSVAIRVEDGEVEFGLDRSFYDKRVGELVLEVWRREGAYFFVGGGTGTRNKGRGSKGGERKGSYDRRWHERGFSEATALSLALVDTPASCKLSIVTDAGAKCVLSKKFHDDEPGECRLTVPLVGE